MSGKIVVDYSPHLEVSFSIEFSDNDVLVRGRSHGEEYSFFDPGVMVFYEDGSSDFAFNLYNDFAALEPAVKRELLAFKVMQVGLIKSCITSHRALQMLFSNKVLLWLLVDFFCYFETKNSDIVRFLGMKRQNIIKLVAGETSPGAVNFLRKILLIDGDRFELEVIKDALVKPELIGKFRHWDSIPVQAIYVSDKRELVSGALFLKDFFERNRVGLCRSLQSISDLYKLAEDTVSLGKSLNFKNAESLVVKCEKESDLKRLHDVWVVKLNKTRELYEPDLLFPECYLPKNDNIIWISSANELIKEARLMRHCAATYVEKANAGVSVLFSVLYPERATLELKKIDKKYSISEIKARGNKDVSKETLDYVRRWVSRFD